MKEQIFNQAKGDSLTTRLITPYSESYIYKGIKIESRDGVITIYNTVNDYSEITPDQYEVFFRLGFRLGTYNVCVYNYNKMLDEISAGINKELTCRNNQKHYKSMKKERLYIMRKYSEILKLK